MYAHNVGRVHWWEGVRGARGGEGRERSEGERAGNDREQGE